MGDSVFLVFFRSGPIGIGFFLVSLGTMLWLLSKAAETEERTRGLKEARKLKK